MGNIMRARLYIRVRLNDGRHPFVEPVSSGNNKIKAFYAIVDGEPEHHPEGVTASDMFGTGSGFGSPLGRTPCPPPTLSGSAMRF